MKFTELSKMGKWFETTKLLASGHEWHIHNELIPVYHLWSEKDEGVNTREIINIMV